MLRMCVAVSNLCTTIQLFALKHFLYNVIYHTCMDIIYLYLYESSNNIDKIYHYTPFSFTAMIPPIELVMVEVIRTTPYSAEISWVTPYVVLDEETYTVQYSTDMPLQNSSEVVVENTDEFAINEKFSVNITGLVPFTTYYYIIQANNSAGNTSTDVMNFTTNHTGI